MGGGELWARTLLHYMMLRQTLKAMSRIKQRRVLLVQGSP